MKKLVLIFSLIIIVIASCKEKGVGGGTVPTPTDFVPGSKLTISSAKNLAEPRINLGVDSVYTGVVLGPMFTRLPAGFDNLISSFYLPKGYMVTFAENSDGSGESSCYVAAQSPIKLNFSPRLLNKVSFIRYIAIDNPTKKGVAFTDSLVVKQFTNASWYYGWSLNRPSFGPMNYVPMTWGKGNATLANVNYLVERKDVNHLLSFNEPDNAPQANIPIIDTAIFRYRTMMATGLRLGSPAPEQDNAINAGKWLPNFMAAASVAKLRVDFICLHWYDWGNENANVGSSDSVAAVAIFNRFKAYVERARAAYPEQKLWLTEYNCNPSRDARPALVKYFMKLSSDWMNTTTYVERYAYFQQKSDAVASNGLLNDVATYWNSLTSTPVFPLNVE